MKTEKVNTGAKIFDSLLEGGYEKGIITTIYGPSASGKTNLCLILCNSIPGKIIFIDTENSFSFDRFKQLAGSEYQEKLDKILFLRPTNFEAQKKAIETLKGILTEEVNLIIIDGIAMLYRIAMARDDSKSVSNELGLQLHHLSETARKNNIPIIITSQVYADFTDKDKVNIVGGDTIKYASKCMIELQKNDTKRRAILVKHRSIAEGKKIKFVIEDKGIYEELKS